MNFSRSQLVVEMFGLRDEQPILEKYETNKNARELFFSVVPKAAKYYNKGIIESFLPFIESFGFLLPATSFIPPSIHFICVFK